MAEHRTATAVAPDACVKTVNIVADERDLSTVYVTLEGYGDEVFELTVMQTERMRPYLLYGLEKRLLGKTANEADAAIFKMDLYVSVERRYRLFLEKKQKGALTPEEERELKKCEEYLGHVGAA